MSSTTQRRSPSTRIRRTSPGTARVAIERRSGPASPTSAAFAPCSANARRLGAGPLREFGTTSSAVAAPRYRPPSIRCTRRPVDAAGPCSVGTTGPASVASDSASRSASRGRPGSSKSTTPPRPLTYSAPSTSRIERGITPRSSEAISPTISGRSGSASDSSTTAVSSSTAYIESPRTIRSQIAPPSPNSRNAMRCRRNPRVGSSTRSSLPKPQYQRPSWTVWTWWVPPT